jgi:hypothetical protein
MMRLIAPGSAIFVEFDLGRKGGGVWVQQTATRGLASSRGTGSILQLMFFFGMLRTQDW